MFRAVQASSSTAARQLHTSASSKAGWESFLPSFLRKQSSPPPPSSSSSTPGSSSTSTPAISSTEQPASTNLFDEIAEEAARSRRVAAKEHRYSTAHHKISPRKLNMLSRQIAGLPIDEAIVQMQFSEKRASKWIKSTLCLARDHAMDKGLSRDKMIVADTWTNKGQYIKRLDIKGRGRAGIKHHPTAKLHVVLREGKTQMEKQEARFKKELDAVRSAGVVREDGVLRRKVVSGWAW